MRIWAGALVLFAIAIGAFAAQSPSQATADDHYDCVNFANQAQAQEFFFPGDPNDLDPDKNGIACDGLPCPCSSAGSAEDDPGEGSQQRHLLSIRAAERIAKSQVAGLARRSPQFQSWSFNACRRVSTRGVDCLLGTQGESIFRRVACRYEVAVRAKKRRLVGRIVAHECKAVSLPHLTRGRARRAMQATVDEIADPKAIMPPILLVREDRLNFAAEVNWLIEPDRATGTEAAICLLKVHARLSPKADQVQVDFGNTLCATL